MVLYGRVDSGLSIAATDRETGQSVIIPLGNRIELVVMAPGTTHCESQECFGHHINPIVHPVGFIFTNVDRGMNFLSQEPESRSNQRFIDWQSRSWARIGVSTPSRFNQIACNLFSQKTVVRDIGIDGSNHVITKLPCIGNNGFKLMPASFRVPSQIEPMSPPAFSELDGRKQPIHNHFQGFRIFVVNKLFYLFRRRRKADEIEIDTPQQRAFFCGRSRHQSLRFERREDESVHLGKRPFGFRDLGSINLFDPLPAPVLGCSFGEVKRFDCPRLHNLFRPGKS